MTATARALAKEFLQSVVVVDDQAAFAGEDAAATVGCTPAGAAAGTVSPDDWQDSGGAGASRGRARRRLPKVRAPLGGGPQPVPEQALNAKVLVDGFAEQGLVCAIIRPESSEGSPVARTVLAAQRADIVILDWDLNGDRGASTLKIVHHLVHEAEPLGRLRLIAIYSGALTLRQIGHLLRTALAKERGIARFRRQGAFAITRDAVRIVIVAKPTTRLKLGDRALRARVVAAEELPSRLVDEFAEMTTGLVPHVAVASLAALRKNTHRVLGRLLSNLDPAYLWHRATQQRPADAETHLVDLVAGELRSVLEDERVGDWANLDAITQWIARDKRTDFATAFGETTPRPAADVLTLLEKGAADRGDANKDVRMKFPKMCVERNKPKSKGAHREEGIAGFAATPAVSKQSNETLAALMSLRTRYEHPPPRLELGTILMCGRGKSRTYWLCVQPRCDSVRLKGNTAFPLLPLRLVGDTQKFDVLLPGDRKGYRRFRLSKKPAHIDMAIFPVHPSDNDAVVAERYGKGFAFRSRKRRRYVWVAELQPEYAQRIAQQVANEFSRVGLTESEWLRLWATKE
ncbi:MAG TPA: response regulator receiver domain [Thermoanaerobaculia bacterium]|nr:response regulator receiver domain [Thermoanaerobaculia bacterium]